MTVCGGGHQNITIFERARFAFVALQTTYFCPVEAVASRTRSIEIRARPPAPPMPSRSGGFERLDTSSAVPPWVHVLADEVVLTFSPPSGNRSSIEPTFGFGRVPNRCHPAWFARELSRSLLANRGRSAAGKSCSVHHLRWSTSARPSRPQPHHFHIVAVMVLGPNGEPLSVIGTEPRQGATHVAQTCTDHLRKAVSCEKMWEERHDFVDAVQRHAGLPRPTFSRSLRVR